jgi:hypothetical protein
MKGHLAGAWNLRSHNGFRLPGGYKCTQADSSRSRHRIARFTTSSCLPPDSAMNAYRAGRPCGSGGAVLGEIPVQRSPAHPKVFGDVPPSVTVGLHSLCGGDVLKVVHLPRPPELGAVGADLHSTSSTSGPQLRVSQLPTLSASLVAACSGVAWSEFQLNPFTWTDPTRTSSPVSHGPNARFRRGGQ